MSARETRQQTLDGRIVRDRPPTDGVARVLDTLPPSTSWGAAVWWTRAVRERDADRVVAWIERAVDEGEIGGQP